jgi:hypothetical protein
MKKYIIEVEPQMVDDRVSDTAQGINRLLAINGKSPVSTERERDDSVSFAERQIAVCINLPRNSLAVKVREKDFYDTSDFEKLFDEVVKAAEFEDYGISTSESDCGHIDGFYISGNWYYLDISVIQKTTSSLDMRTLLRSLVVKYLYDFDFEG